MPLSASLTRKRRSVVRSRATFASPPSIGHFQSAEQMFNRLSGERRCSLACIAIYRVAVGFMSRRISKGPRSAFHSFQALLLYSAAVTTRNGRTSILKASFSIKERSDDRYLRLVCLKYCLLKYNDKTATRSPLRLNMSNHIFVVNSNRDPT